MRIGWLTSASAMDVNLDSLQAFERANALFAQSTCASRGSCAEEKELNHQDQNSLPLFIVLAVVFALMLGFVLPRFAAYFLGPAFLVLAAALLVVGHRLFVPFQSDGSPAGLIVPAIAWIALIVCCGLGITLIVTGRARIKRTRSQI
jgi:lipopolysaccharide export LptBFGC system permease protein LptF